MGKQRAKKPTLAQKKWISDAGLRPDHWLVWDEDNISLTLISRRTSRRRVILK